jgi:hypothetical protein
VRVSNLPLLCLFIIIVIVVFHCLSSVVRPYMEDRHHCAFDENGTRFYAVFDGHGGHEVRPPTNFLVFDFARLLRLPRTSSG